MKIYTICTANHRPIGSFTTESIALQSLLFSFHKIIESHEVREISSNVKEVQLKLTSGQSELYYIHLNNLEDCVVHL